MEKKGIPGINGSTVIVNVNKDMFDVESEFEAKRQEQFRKAILGF